MRYLVPAFGACLMLAACSQPAQKPAEAPPVEVAVAPPPAAAPAGADWSSLEPLVGKSAVDTKLFDESVIAPDLKALLGPKFEVLKTNTQTASPLQKEAGVYYLLGNKAHQGGVDDAYLLVDPATRALEVGLREAGKLTVYATPGATIAKPKDVQTTLANAAAG